MSELIDVACDICGKQYRWPDERLGETALCRYCGTKFEVKLYVPPEDDTNAKDLQWFKGVGVAILVVSVAVGLSSLLFIRPGQTGWNTASIEAMAMPSLRAPHAPKSDAPCCCPMPATGHFHLLFLYLERRRKATIRCLSVV